MIDLLNRPQSMIGKLRRNVDSQHENEYFLGEQRLKRIR